MDLATAGTLVLLALADSTSFGTLLIPVWLLLATGRPRPGRMLVYLGTVAAFYVLVGIVLSLGARVLLGDLQSWLATTPGAIATALVGVVLLVSSFVIGRRKGGPSARVLRWRERAISEGSLVPLMVLALTATALEVATMLPYLVAIGIMDGADLDVATHGLVLAGYCLVMVLPALALLGVRLVAHSAVEPLLRRVNGWFERSAGETTAWIVGIVGVLLIREGASGIDDLGALLQGWLHGLGLE